MSDSGGTRLTIDNDLYQAQPPTNPLLFGDPEAGGAAAASQAMAPVIGPYLRDVFTGEIARRSLNELHAPYDPNKSFRENVLNPQAMEAAQNIALGFSGGGLSTRGLKTGPLPRLWHGSAEELRGGRFDPMQIGRGEGYHGEGYGGYVSEAQRVAQWYRDHYGRFTDEQIDLAKRAILDADPSINLTVLEEQMGGRTGFRPEDWFDLAEDLSYKAKQHYARPQPGALYEMEYPGARIEEFLRWDKSLKDQSPYVKQQLKRMGVEEGKPAGKDWELQGTDKTMGSSLTGQTIYHYLGAKYGSWTKDLTMNPSGDPATAAVMRLNGIRGVRYPASEAHYPPESVFNYSIFNPENLNVIKKYGMAGLMAGAGSSMMIGEAGAAGSRWENGYRLTPVDHNPFANE